MDSSFIYPVTVHRNGSNGSTTATWLNSLPLAAVDEQVAVLFSSEGKQPQGLYLYDGTRRQWRFVLPYPALCVSIIDSGTINVYYAVTNPNSGLPAGTLVWRNGIETDDTTFTVNDGSVFGAITYPNYSAGSVTSVNGESPDSNGNVQININDIPGLTAALAAAGQVKTVNGAGPDSNGNVVVPVATGTTVGTVKPGTGLSVASDGTLNATAYSLPVATATTLGGVKQGSGVTIAADGTLSANVLSVNSRTGAITLTSTDVGLPTDLLSGTGGTLGSAYVPAYLLGAVNYQGTWNAATNTPAIASGSASATNKGYYYVVSVAGTTTVDGISTWQIGDWIISDGVNWSRVPVNQMVVSVSGQTGAVVIQASDSNTASGTTLISNSGATTGNIKLRRIVAGTNVSVGTDANGNVVINNTSPASITAVESTGTGVSLVNNDGTTGGIGLIKSLAAGSNIVLTPDAQNQTLTITATQNTPATTTSLGSVIVKAGLAVDGSGNLSLVAPSGANLGGVKAGTNITIAADGTISSTNSYTLPVASATVLGGVKQGTGVSIAGDGTISAAVTSVSGQTGAVVVQASDNSTASGTSLIANSGATTGNVKLLRLVAGSNVTISPDGNGNLTIASTGGGGTSGITQVESVGTGASMINNDGTTGGIAMVKSLAAGSNITITPDGQNQTLTVSATLNTPATTTSLGAVIVKAGLAVDGSGNLSLAAPSGVNLGGVKAGTNISIAADGTISASGGGAVTSVSGQIGAVVISAIDNNDTTGVSLIANSGANTGTIKLKNIVAGSGMTLTQDANGNLVLTSTGGYTLPVSSSTTLGGVIIPAGSGLAIDSSGNLTNTGVTSLTFNSSTQTGGITVLAGSGIQFVTTGNQNTIEVVAGTLLDAPSDNNEYVRQNAEWVAIPSLSDAVTSITSDATAGSHSILESAPPANSAVTKSISAGTNVAITDNGTNLVITANVPGVVASVNGVQPNGSGNVTLTPANISAVPIAGGVTMTGPLNFGSQVLNGIPNPVNPTDAVNYQTLTGLSIDGGVIG